MRKVDIIELYDTKEVYVTKEVKEQGYEQRHDHKISYELYPKDLEDILNTRLDSDARWEPIRVYEGELEECVYKKLYAEVMSSGILNIVVHWGTPEGNNGTEEYTYCGKFFINWAKE